MAVDIRLNLMVDLACLLDALEDAVLTRFGLPERLLRVAVPPGVAPGALLRLKGLGRTGPDGARGDLYLRVAVDEG